MDHESSADNILMHDKNSLTKETKHKHRRSHKTKSKEKKEEAWELPEQPQGVHKQWNHKIVEVKQLDQEGENSFSQLVGGNAIVKGAGTVATNKNDP